MGKFSILLVDSTQDTLTSLSDALQTMDMKVRTSSDGSHAAGLLRTEKFDAIILDTKLPNMNGLQVASIARSSELNRKALLWIISANIDDAARERAQKIGVHEVRSKPVNPGEVAEQIKKRLETIHRPLKYDVKVINAFVKAATDVFEYYFQKKPEMGKPNVRDFKATRPNAYVTGLISLQGSGFVGSMGLSVDAAFVRSLAEKIFQGQEVKLDNELIADITGEMCNQVLGKVKFNFSELGVKITIGLPEVIIGENHMVIHKVKNPVLVLPIRIDKLGCEMEFCLDQTDIQVDESKAETAPAESVMLWD